MRVTQTEPVEPGDITLRLSQEEGRMLAALADFPAWPHQPEELGDFCAALHARVCSLLPEPAYADGSGFVPRTTVQGG